jgi:uncharacterized FlgJ-related protein
MRISLTALSIKFSLSKISLEKNEHKTRSAEPSGEYHSMKLKSDRNRKTQVRLLLKFVSQEVVKRFWPIEQGKRIIIKKEYSTYFSGTEHDFNTLK